LGGAPRLAPGQAYVALSRARSAAGLQVAGFGDGAVLTDPAAVRFHDALAAGPAALGAFLAGAPAWWEPVVQGGHDPAWRALFEAAPAFRGWVARHGPAGG
jgi:hypothetical protein